MDNISSHDQLTLMAATFRANGRRLAEDDILNKMAFRAAAFIFGMVLGRAGSKDELTYGMAMFMLGFVASEQHWAKSEWIDQ